MADRSLLHLSQLHDFVAFARGLGYVEEPTKGLYEVLRLRHRTLPVLIYHRRTGADHASAEGDGLRLVRAFLRSKKETTV